MVHRLLQKCAPQHVSGSLHCDCSVRDFGRIHALISQPFVKYFETKTKVRNQRFILS